MCWMCDNPEATYEDLEPRIVAAIERYGWWIQLVEGEGSFPPFAYTVGLTAHGLPELVMTGRPADTAMAVLNVVAANLAYGAVPPFRAGMHVDLDGHPDIEIVDLPEPSAHLFVAVNLFGPEIRAQQLVYADEQGHWPWEFGFGRQQPVLGPRHPKAS